MSNRTVLVESVRLSVITNQLSRLPTFSQTDLKPASGSALYALSETRISPASRLARIENGHMQLAKQTPCNQGFVLDYVVVNGGGNLTFQSGTTYFIAGPVNPASLKIEGGSVIKYPDNTTTYIEIYAGILFACPTSPYQPSLFTAADDDTVGEDVEDAWAGHAGVIQPGGYADPALKFDANCTYTLENVRICYAKEAILAEGGASITLQDSQIINCIKGVSLYANANATLNNCLLTTAGLGSYYSTGGILAGGGSYASYNLTYCTVDDANEYELN